MSWIPKTGGSFDGPTMSQDLPGLVPMVAERIEADQPGPVVAHLTREEKSKAKKEAEDYQEAGMSLGARWTFPRLQFHFQFGSLWQSCILRLCLVSAEWIMPMRAFIPVPKFAYIYIHLHIYKFPFPGAF